VSVDIIRTPGQWTDVAQPVGDDAMRKLVSLGYEWMTFQLVNGSAKIGIGVDAARRTGFGSCGGWGVVYDVGDFHAFGRRFAEELVRTGADHAIVDAEQCAKFTRWSRGMNPIIVGMREGGWYEPVHLSTLGAPEDALPHGPNDFAIDADSFLATGGGIHPQAYFNAYEDYRPDLCFDYWRACGVPDDRISLTIDLATEPGSAKYPVDYTGAEWAELLVAAEVHRNFSVFMTQFGTAEDWEGLHPMSQQRPEPVVPTTPPPTTPPIGQPVKDTDARATVRFASHAWEQSQSGYPAKARLVVARRICDEANTNEKWQAMRDDILALLDGAGIPK
jgi:hypothetical protein